MAARLIVCLLVLPFLAQAAESGPSDELKADWLARTEKGQALKHQGGEQKRAAKELFEARKKECFKKFQVYACQNEAKQTYIQSLNDARRLENEGEAIVHQVKKEQMADKDARRRAQAPEREAERQTRLQETTETRIQAEQERSGKLADHERKAAEGSRKRAEDEARIRAKQEKHARKVEEKMEKSRRREAEAGQ